MSAVDNYVEQNAQVHQFAAEVARIISGIPQMPEFSSENMTVADASQLIGLPVTSIRAGIVCTDGCRLVWLCRIINQQKAFPVAESHTS